jgi:hypothetical protein
MEIFIFCDFWLEAIEKWGFCPGVRLPSVTFQNGHLDREI